MNGDVYAAWVSAWSDPLPRDYVLWRQLWKMEGVRRLGRRRRAQEIKRAMVSFVASLDALGLAASVAAAEFAGLVRETSLLSEAMQALAAAYVPDWRCRLAWPRWRRRLWARWAAARRALR